jgi:hypothetical protein
MALGAVLKNLYCVMKKKYLKSFLLLQVSDDKPISGVSPTRSYLTDE